MAILVTLNEVTAETALAIRHGGNAAWAVAFPQAAAWLEKADVQAILGTTYEKGKHRGLVRFNDDDAPIAEAFKAMMGGA